MTTRRQLLGTVSAASAAFAVTGRHLLEGTPVFAQEVAQPLAGHFHPKGKAPSAHTLEVLKAARATLPFADTRDFDEQKKGFIAPMPDLKIMADAGHVAWDMERFQFLDEEDEFDSIHPSLLRQSRLNNNYGLYEVIPGIYQVRGFDLSDITFVRGKTGWIVFDPLVERRAGARRVGAVPEACRRGPAGHGGDLFAHPWRPLGRRARPRRRGGRALGQGRAHRARSTSWTSPSPRTSMPATR